MKRFFSKYTNKILFKITNQNLNENLPIELVTRITKTNIKKFKFVNCFYFQKISENTNAEPATYISWGFAEDTKK